MELRTWHVCPPAVVHHPLPIPATVIPYKSNSIAPTLPSSSHDHISSSSLQRAPPPFWSPIPAFGVPLLQPAPLRCKAPPQSSSPRPSPHSVWFSHLFRRWILGSTWSKLVYTQFTAAAFYTLPDIVWCSCVSGDSIYRLRGHYLVAHNQISTFWERLFLWQSASTRQRSFGATHS